MDGVMDATTSRTLDMHAFVYDLTHVRAKQIEETPIVEYHQEGGSMKLRAEWVTGVAGDDIIQAFNPPDLHKILRWLRDRA
eukprot:4374965-Amphidinium_carterae.1